MSESLPATQPQPDVPQVQIEGDDLIGKARALRRRAGTEPDIEAFEEAFDLDTAAKDLRPKVVDFFKDMKQKAKAAHQAICDRENSVLDPIDEARKICRSIMKRRNEMDEEEAARAKQPDPDEQVALEAARDADVEQLRIAGHEQAALDLAAQPLPAPTKPIETAIVPATPGLSFRTRWTGRIDDIDKAKVSIAQNPALRATLLEIDQSALNDAMQRSDGSLKIDGVTAVRDRPPVNRR